jgi:hypothetical protein
MMQVSTSHVSRAPHTYQLDIVNMNKHAARIPVAWDMSYDLVTEKVASTVTMPNC